ncbi:MAG: hypothetical protein ACPGPH_03480 [Synechococcus sp.]
MPQTPRVTALQRGGRRDVQGVNPIQELNEALKPLSKLYDAGVEMYASNEYRKGQNELLRAAANVNRDMMEKSLLYAAQNREVDRSNPIAGLLMDQSNPFRQAGRVNQASQWVASQTAGQFRAEWTRMAGALQALDPSNPAVTAVQAKITNQLANAFGLDEFSPGFQQYVLPQVNKSWEWFQKQQLAAHTKYQKAVGARQTADMLSSALLSSNGVTDQKWIEMIAQQMASYGLSGEPQEMIRKAMLMTAQRLALMQTDPANAQAAQIALARLNNMPSGIFDEAGQPIKVSEAYGMDLLSDRAEISRDVKTLRDNRKAAATDAVEMDPTFQETIGLDPQSPRWQSAFDKLRANPAYEALSDAELRKILNDQSKAAESWQGVTFDAQAVDGFIFSQQNAFGSEWDEGSANQTFRQLIENAPQSERRRLQEKWEQVRQDKRAEAKGDIDSTLMRDVVDRKIKALTERLFPDQKAELLRWMNENPGGDIVEYLGSVDAQKAELIQAARRSYMSDGIRKIRSETAKRQGRLDPADQLDAWEKTWTQNRESYMPDPGPQPATPAPATGGNSSEAKPPLPTQFYSPSQAVPEEAIRSGQQIYEAGEINGLLTTMANGGQAPTQFKRSARAAGMTPGEFLLRQAGLAGFEIPPQMEKKIEQRCSLSQTPPSPLHCNFPVPAHPSPLLRSAPLGRPARDLTLSGSATRKSSI